MKHKGFSCLLLINLLSVDICCSKKEMMVGPPITTSAATTTFTNINTNASTCMSGYIDQNGKGETSTMEECFGRQTTYETSESPQYKQDESIQPGIKPPLKDSFQIDINKTQSCEKALVLKDKKDDSLMVEIADTEKVKDNELIVFFEGLDVKLKKVTKFYYYYDVLSYIDRTIALIYEFLVIPNSNISRNSMIIRRTNRKVYPDLRKMQDVCNIIKNNNQDLSKFSCVKNELNIIEKQVKCLKTRYNFERDKKIQNEYYIDNPNKHKELTKLQNDLKDIRTILFPMEETTIEKYADFLKNECLKYFSEVYNSLNTCFEEENNSLDWLFEVLNGIMNDARTLIGKLNLHDEFLKNKKQQLDDV